MKKLLLLCAAAALGACAQAPIQLKDMGSFHIGGREAVISGKPVKEVVFTPDGVPAKVDPNGVYAGGRYDVIDLPKIGITGNSHMIVMDRNSDQVAGLIQGWLEKQGLYR